MDDRQVFTFNSVRCIMVYLVHAVHAWRHRCEYYFSGYVLAKTTLEYPDLMLCHSSGSQAMRDTGAVRDGTRQFVEAIFAGLHL